MEPIHLTDNKPSLTIKAWDDPLTDPNWHHPLSVYVELFWLPVLGPSATWLVRRSAIFLLGNEEGFTAGRDWLSMSLGLGDGSGLTFAVERCVRFSVAKRLGASRIAMRRMLPPLPAEHVDRLDPMMSELLRTWGHRTPQSLAALESV
jgi:hypothetical protein